ncbi:MAG: tetratricopeptide repeat protein [Nitrospirae bacterium]|nr:tetratricopeptide repeat protein [Nitrospirota bacterium]
MKAMDKNDCWVEKSASLIILWGLLVIIFFRPLVSGITWSWSNTYSQILILFLLAVWFLRMIVKGEFVFRRTPLDIPIFLFLLSLTISLFNSVNKAVSFNQLYQFFSYPALYFLIINNLPERLTRRQATVLIFSLSLTVALAGAVWLNNTGMPLPLALFPALVVIIVSIPLLRSSRIAGGEDINIYSLLLPLLLIVAVLVSLYGIYQHYWGLEQTRQMLRMHDIGRLPPNFLARLETNKVFSTFVFPPALAGYLIIILPLALVLFFYVKSVWGRILLGLTLGIGWLCLYFTYSKGGWVSFIFSLAFLFFILGRKHRRLFFVSFLIVIGLFLLLLFSGILPYVNSQGFMDSFRVRVEYWKGGLAMLKDYFLFGSGLGTFGSLYAKYKLVGAEETQLAHNNYLQIWIETGILGIISFLWLWGAFLKAGWRTVKDKLISVPGFQRSSQEEEILAPLSSTPIPLRARVDTGNLQKSMVVGLYIGVVAFLIHSLVDFDLYVQGIATYIWLFMGMVIFEESRGKLYPGGYRQVKSYKLTNTFARIVIAVVIVSTIAFLMVTVKKPLVAERYFQQSFIYLKQGSVNMALEQVNAAIRMNPGKGAYYYRLGSIYQSKGLLDDAISQYRKAIKRNPFMPHYHSTLGKVLWDKAGGKDAELMEEAVQEFEKARDLYPTKATYRMLLGRIYELRGRKKEAIQQYNKALELDPSLEGVKDKLKVLKGRIF